MLLPNGDFLVGLIDKAHHHDRLDVEILLEILGVFLQRFEKFFIAVEIEKSYTLRRMEVTSFAQTKWFNLLVKESDAEGFFQSLHDAKIMMNGE